MKSLDARLAGAERAIDAHIESTLREILLPLATPEEGEALIRILEARDAGQLTDTHRQEVEDIMRTLFFRARDRDLLDWEGS